MRRNKNIVILSHCLLNCNSKVEGLANYKGSLKELIDYIINKDYGIIQLPCPELTLYGVKRWGHVKEQFDTPYYRKHCRKILIPYIEQIKDYIKNDYNIKSIIGVDGSPSCGVNKSCFSSKWGGTLSRERDLKDEVCIKSQKGVFVEEFARLLNKENVDIEFRAIDENYPKKSINFIKNHL